MLCKKICGEIKRFTDNELGLSYDYGRTLFTSQQTEETKVDLAPYNDNVVLKEETTLIQMFYRAYSFKPNEYDFGYIPFQFIQVLELLSRRFV